MPANKYALLRYRIIDRTLRNPGKPYPSKEDLREACEEALYGSLGDHISSSTIDKDLWAMRNEGELGYYAPIKFSKNHGGYYYEDPDFTIAEVPLNDDDLDALRVAAQTLYQFKEIPLFSHFDAAIDKIMDRMNISGEFSADDERQIIQFEETSVGAGGDFMPSIFNAIKEGRSLDLVYRKFNDPDARALRFDPYILKEYRNRWYVIGFSHKHNRIITLGLERLEELEVLKDRFKRIASFDAEKYFRHSVGITAFEGDASLVRIAVESEFAQYLLTQPIHPSQKVIEEGERVVLELNVLITIELISVLLGFGEKVEVLAPNELREQMKNALFVTLNLYK